MGRIIPYIMENKTCSKPPTSAISSSKIPLKSTPVDLLATLPAAQLARLARLAQLARATCGAIGGREGDAVAQGGEAQGGKPRRECGRKPISMGFPSLEDQPSFVTCQ